MFPRAVLIIAAILFVEFLWIAIAGTSPGKQLFGWFIERAVLVLATLYALLSMKQLLEAGQRIAKGELDCKVDTSKLRGPFKEHGEDLNSITDGMNRAVGERMKSERFRTELITNVSHDIKTPLTSIINYVDLLEKEQPQIGILVNAAGCGVFGPFAEADRKKLISSAQLNSLALTGMCHASLPYMHSGSNIINMGSNSAWQPVPFQAVYGASKSYVLSLSRALGRELRPQGIHVMCVCPGWIKTEFQQVAHHDEFIRYVDKWYGPDEVAAQAMKDLKKKKSVSILGHPVRRQVRLVKLLPVDTVMDIWCKQQGIE